MKEINDFTKLKVGEWVIEEDKEQSKKVFLSKVLKICDSKEYDVLCYLLSKDNTEISSGEFDDEKTHKRGYRVYRLNTKEKEKYMNMIILFKISDKNDED
ncbi:unnamed protein product [marine sediment metagenome]|uniref:Uncharacterized protein n=1 Tax=marine sediment metagenome TaxID=412755 RepID=X1IT02_9ZZZZ